MVDLFGKYKDFSSQSIADKMFVLKLIAHKELGSKWGYFKKIKHGGEGFSFLREKTLMDQMKATQSALRFTSKNAKKLFRQTYLATMKDIKRYTGLKSGFPELPDDVEGAPLPSLTSSHDAVIIAWTPVKFFQPAKIIREKGLATQRHSEGLIAKLFFKVVGYYSDPRNWDVHKLSIYLRKIKPEMNYSEIVAELEPLKTDLEKFCEVYELFKFGKASLSKDVAKDTDSFDDAMGVDSFEEQVRTLYWYHFIYLGIEQFFFRYYISLVTSTSNKMVMKYLTTIFEPVLIKVIENKNVFLGSFEIDRTKKVYFAPYEKYKEERKQDPPSFKIKTKNCTYQSLNYNLNLLERFSISFEILSTPSKDSGWVDFIKTNVLGIEPVSKESEQTEDEDKKGPTDVVDEYHIDIPFEDREYALMQIMTMMINCTQFRRQARHKILERFKVKAEEDKGLVEKRLAEVRKKADKKLREMTRKITKLKRMKQEDSVGVYEQDIDKFKQRVEEMCENIKTSSTEELVHQKKRLKILFDEIGRENNINAGFTSKIVLNLANQLDPETSFKRGFSKYVANNIQEEYSKELEPFYRNIFEILEPPTQEKVMIVQALDRSGGAGGVKLSLSDEEKQEVEDLVARLKEKIAQHSPGVFESKLIFMSLIIPFDDIFKIGLDNHSLKVLLSVKVTTPKKPQGFKLPIETIKSLLVLNLVKNPVPKNSIIIDGKGSETDPLKAISQTKLNRLLANLP
ncbi:MAG: hypothetical protein OEY59_05765 [Deltaproteobacteria bacterium]|nr:hypothetical protein [Deltaproteobacteria bacterium]